jgi:hypothetical protein
MEKVINTWKFGTIYCLEIGFTCVNVEPGQGIYFDRHFISLYGAGRKVLQNFAKITAGLYSEYRREI